MSLAHLPAEVVYGVIEYLDVQSIYNLSLSNRTIHSKVNDHSIYHLLRTNPTTTSALKIFKQTTILPTHPLSTLTTTLKTDTCTCCRDRTAPAPYIYLLTAERACMLCLHHCPRFQMIPVHLASKTFGLPFNTFKSISLLTVPGRYDTDIGVLSHTLYANIVNAAQARDLAVKVLGATTLDRYMAERNIDVAPNHMPLATFGLFATPYTSMSFEVCGAAVGVVADKWMGITGMGCEPWPVLKCDNDKPELRIDMDQVVGYRIHNLSGHSSVSLLRPNILYDNGLL